MKADGEVQVGELLFWEFDLEALSSPDFASHQFASQFCVLFYVSKDSFQRPFDRC